MGKRIIQQRRGRGTSTYRVRKKSYKYKIQFPSIIEGQGEVIKLFNSQAHSAPLAQIKLKDKMFIVSAYNKMYEGEKIEFNSEVKTGNILELEKIPEKTKVFCIESKPRDGGKFIKTGGTSGTVTRKVGGKVFISMPSKKEKGFNPKSRAIIGQIAGHGRLEKPVLKAGKKYHIKKSKGKLWPRTSAVKMNAIDHPFGSGRAKNPKSKIAKRNAAPGKKVGLLRPKRTGKRK